MGSSVLFPARQDLSQSDHDLLSEAYEEACDQLMGQHGYSSHQLSITLEETASTLLRLFEAGIRDRKDLGMRAASQIHDAVIKSKRSRLRSLEYGPRR